MLGAAAEYRTVVGIHPDENKHNIFADIEPVKYFLIFKQKSKYMAKKLYGVLAFWISCPWRKACPIEYVSEENQSNRYHRKSENMFDANPLDRRGEFECDVKEFRLPFVSLYTNFVFFFSLQSVGS